MNRILPNCCFQAAARPTRVAETQPRDWCVASVLTDGFDIAMGKGTGSLFLHFATFETGH